MPPPPPPPPAKDFKPPPKTKDRGAMLKSIEGFKKGKLKKTETVDKSAPSVGGVKTSVSSTPQSTGGSSSGSSSVSYASPSPGASMGGIFAGAGVPKLRKTGLPGSSTMIPGAKEPTSAPTTPITPNNQKAVPPTRQSRAPPPAAPMTEKPRSLQHIPSSAPPPSKAPPQVTSRPPVKSSSGGLTFVIAIYPFDGQRKDDLTFLPDDIICVTNKNPPGSGNGNWWEGVLLSGVRGNFPNNYVKELSIIDSRKVSYDYNAVRGDELSLKSGSTIDLYLRRDSGWWLGSLDGKYGLFPSNFLE